MQVEISGETNQIRSHSVGCRFYTQVLRSRSFNGNKFQRSYRASESFAAIDNQVVAEIIWTAGRIQAAPVASPQVDIRQGKRKDIRASKGYGWRSSNVVPRRRSNRQVKPALCNQVSKRIDDRAASDVS